MIFIALNIRNGSIGLAKFPKKKVPFRGLSQKGCRKGSREVDGPCRQAANRAGIREAVPVDLFVAGLFEKRIFGPAKQVWQCPGLSLNSGRICFRPFLRTCETGGPFSSSELRRRLSPVSKCPPTKAVPCNCLETPTLGYGLGCAGEADFRCS